MTAPSLTAPCRSPSCVAGCRLPEGRPLAPDSGLPVLFPDLDGHWFAVLEDDRRALALYLRHYSSTKARGNRAAVPLRGNAAKFVGPGASMVLLTTTADAVFVWRKQEYRKDGQVGVECSIFRNESPILASELIREADALAWKRWPGERHFTFVDDAKVRSTNPGACFKKAGWRTCGRNADGRLTILEILPTSFGRPSSRAYPVGRRDGNHEIARQR